MRANSGTGGTGACGRRLFGAAAPRWVAANCKSDRLLVAALQQGDEGQPTTCSCASTAARCSPWRAAWFATRKMPAKWCRSLPASLPVHPLLREEARLSTWLHRIVVNAALMRLRSASRRPEVAIDDLLPRFDDEGQHGDPIRPLPMSVDRPRTGGDPHPGARRVAGCRSSTAP